MRQEPKSERKLLTPTDNKLYRYPPRVRGEQDPSPVTEESLVKCLAAAKVAEIDDEEDFVAIRAIQRWQLEDVEKALALLATPPLLPPELRRCAFYEILENSDYASEIVYIYSYLNSPPLQANFEKNLEQVRKMGSIQTEARRGIQLLPIYKALALLKEEGFLDQPHAQRYVDVAISITYEGGHAGWWYGYLNDFLVFKKICNEELTHNDTASWHRFRNGPAINVTELAKLPCKKDFHELFMRAPLAMSSALHLCDLWQRYGLLAGDQGRQNVQRLVDEGVASALRELCVTIQFFSDPLYPGEEIKKLSPLLVAPQGHALLNRIFAAYQKDSAGVFAAIRLLRMLPKNSSLQTVQNYLTRIFPPIVKDAKQEHKATVAAPPLKAQPISSPLPRSPQAEHKAETLERLRDQFALQNFPANLVSLIESYHSPDTESDEMQLQIAKDLVARGSSPAAVNWHAQLAVCSDFAATLTFYLDKGLIRPNELLTAWEDNERFIGWTYLTLAVANGCVETARVLLDRVLSMPGLATHLKCWWLDFKDNNHMSPLAHAVKRVDVEMTRALLACGAAADVSIPHPQQKDLDMPLICFAAKIHKNNPTPEAREILSMLFICPSIHLERLDTYRSKPETSVAMEYICSQFYPAIQLSVAANMKLGFQPAPPNASLDKKDGDRPDPGCLVA